jgi:hypothetical protein
MRRCGFKLLGIGALEPCTLWTRLGSRCSLRRSRLLTLICSSVGLELIL